MKIMTTSTMALLREKNANDHALDHRHNTQLKDHPKGTKTLRLNDNLNKCLIPMNNVIPHSFSLYLLLWEKYEVSNREIETADSNLN